jgi:hypothetical protein
MGLWHPLRDEINQDIRGHKSRGKTVRPETIIARDKTFELLDAEVEACRNPFARKVATVIGSLVMQDPGKIRVWRKEWAAERGYN